MLPNGISWRGGALLPRRGCCCVETDFYLRAWSGFQEQALRALCVLRSWRNDSMSAAQRRRKQERDDDVAWREG
jgi:hypothetical protein